MYVMCYVKMYVTHEIAQYAQNDENAQKRLKLMISQAEHPKNSPKPQKWPKYT